MAAAPVGGAQYGKVELHGGVYEARIAHVFQTGVMGGGEGEARCTSQALQQGRCQCLPLCRVRACPPPPTRPAAASSRPVQVPPHHSGATRNPPLAATRKPTPRTENPELFCRSRFPFFRIYGDNLPSSLNIVLGASTMMAGMCGGGRCEV